MDQRKVTFYEEVEAGVDGELHRSQNSTKQTTHITEDFNVVIRDDKDEEDEEDRKISAMLSELRLGKLEVKQNDEEVEIGSGDIFSGSVKVRMQKGKKKFD